MNITTTIQHIIVMPVNLKEENFTFFQGFSREIAMDYGRILSCLSKVPHDILEPRLGFQSLVASKMIASSLDVIHVKEDLLDDNHINFNSHFTFIWSTEKTLKNVLEACNKFIFKPIHISCKKHPDTIYIHDVNENTITDAINKLRDVVIKDSPDKDFTEYLNNQKKEDLEKNPFPFLPLGHNCSAPSMNALVSCGYELKDIEVVVPSENIEQHVEGIVKLASLIDSIRAEQKFSVDEVKNEGIVYCPSYYAHLYKYNSQLWNDLNRTLPKIERNFIKDLIIRNKGFSNSSFNKVGAGNIDPTKFATFRVLMQERQIELGLTTEIISVISSNQFCPAIRLPNGVMLHHDQLKNIASLIKYPSTSKVKSIQNLNKKLILYNKALRDDIGGELFNVAFESRRKLLAICDFPIEWININGFPLMFTHEISRIFPTPGNMFGHIALRSQRVIMPYAVFTEILIIRSFDENDPIKNHLLTAIDTLKEKGMCKNMNIKIVDASNEQELIDGLNTSCGLITIFDCHGGHGGVDSNAWLQIGNDKVDVWSLANKCRIPPIVILSACSTHPIDGSHASVANGFFRCGSVSVLGTYAPISSIHASQFVARLLLRISEFVPLLIENGIVSWREVLTGFLRMSYQTDVLQGMKNELKVINDKQYNDIHIETNMLINSYTVNWQEKFIETIEKFTKFNQKEVRILITENFQFVETMLYSQLGRPENIYICQDEISEVAQEQ